MTDSKRYRVHLDSHNNGKVTLHDSRAACDDAHAEGLQHAGYETFAELMRSGATACAHCFRDEPTDRESE